MTELTVTRERGNAVTRQDLGERGSALGPYQPRWKSVVSAPLRCEAGSALVTVLILIIVLTVIGAAMLTVTLTEITIAFNQADAAVAHDLADAGFARAVSELSSNLAWPGTGGPVAEGDGTYDVTVTSSGSSRFITSTGSRGGGRQILRGSLKAVPRRGMNTIFANTTATIGAVTTGLTVGNTMPSPDATAVHANNRLGAGTAMAINTTGAVVIGGLTSNGPIVGALCPTWPWRCDSAFGTIPLPQINVDAGASSLKARAQSTFDAGKSLYFRGGDTSPGGCKNAPGYNFGLGQTQRCWDKFVNDHLGSIGSNLSNAVFFVEFGPGERTTYTTPGGTAPTFRSRTEAQNGGGGRIDLTINRPVGLAVNDVMVAMIAVRGGSTTAITPPAGWTAANIIDNGTIRLAIYLKVAAAGEPGNYTWTFSSVQRATGGIQAYSGVDTISPVDDAAGQATPSGILHTTPSITTTVANSMLVASFTVATDARWEPPAGMDERVDVRGGGAAGTGTEGADQVQALAGASGAKTALANAVAPGATHLLALRPAGPTVDCVGYVTAAETLCVRSRAATDSNNVVVYPDSAPTRITGAVVAFRRGAGTSVIGNIVMESLSLRTSNYTHTSLAGDPVLVAGGRVEVISSGSAAAQRTVDIIGIVYTFAGQDNPDVNGNLVGSSGVGIDVQHGADLVTLTFHGFLISNGSIAVQDTATNSGVVSVLYDSAVADALPAPFTASSTDNVIFSISWSSGD